MTDHTCQFLDGACDQLARQLWRWSCLACGFFDIRQLCDEHGEMVKSRAERDTMVTHVDNGQGCSQSVSAASFYTYVGKV